MNEEVINKYSHSEDSKINIIKEVSYYLFFWPWFVGLISLLVIGSFFKLRYENRIYKSTAQIQIKKEDSDASSFLTGGLEGLMTFDRVNLENDISVITSQYILEQVVKRLNLQTKTFTFGSIVGSINSKLLFKENLHIKVVFKEPENSKEIEFEVEDNILKVKTDELNYTLTNRY